MASPARAFPGSSEESAAVRESVERSAEGGTTMRSSILFCLTILLGSLFVPAAVAQTGAEVSLKEKAERARTLFKKRSDSEAATLARQVFAQEPDGRAADELRVLLCKARAAGADVG